MAPQHILSSAQFDLEKLNRIEGVIRTETLVILEEQRFLPPNILDYV